MHIIIDLFDFIGLCVLGVLIVGLFLFYIVSLIGYSFSRLIRRIQERLWKK